MNQQTSEPPNRGTAAAGATYNYRNLRAWQEAQELAAEIVAIVRVLPRDAATAAIARQLVAAAGSVAANIAEGHGRFSRAAYRNHLSIAKGSACEADSWLDLLRRTGHISPEQEGALHRRLTALVALLTHKMRALEHDADSRVREDQERYDTDDDWQG